MTLANDRHTNDSQAGASHEPTADELAAERNRLKCELFWLLDEKRRRGLSERHPDHWRWKQKFDAALDAKRRFDDQWGTPT